jgi:hypothetical protein
MPNSVPYLICAFVNLPPNNVFVHRFIMCHRWLYYWVMFIALYLIEFLYCIQRIVNMPEKFMVKDAISAVRVCDVMTTYNRDVMGTWSLHAHRTVRKVPVTFHYSVQHREFRHWNGNQSVVLCKWTGQAAPAGAGITQTVQWLGTRCKTEESWFDSSREKKFPFSSYRPDRICLPPSFLTNGVRDWVAGAWSRR